MFKRSELQILYKYAVALCGNRDDGYDLVQSTVERCIRKSCHISDRLPYARKVLRNIYYDQYRKRATFQEDTYDEENVFSIDCNINTLEDVMVTESIVNKIWKELQPDEREILFLWAVEEYTFQEISELLQVSKGTLLSRIHRLKKRIKREAGDDVKVQVQ